MSDKPRITQAFGVEVEREMDERGQWHILPPPPNVLSVLADIGAREEQKQPGHGAKTQKRRSKRRRLRRRERFIQRQTWRGFFEGEKRRAKEENE